MEVELKPIQVADLHIIVELLNQEKARTQILFDNIRMREDGIVNFLQNTAPGTLAYNFATTLVGADGIIGTITINNVDFRSRSGVITHNAVFPEYGFNASLAGVRKLIEYGFTELNLNRIECRAYEENRLTPLICKKVGAKLEGAMRDYIFIRGEYRNVKVWSLLRREWEHGSEG